jgi:hypothetical protein
LRNITDEMAAADVFRQKKAIDRPMPERRPENRPKEPVVATDDRSEALFAPNVLGNAAFTEMRHQPSAAQGDFPVET